MQTLMAVLEHLPDDLVMTCQNRPASVEEWRKVMPAADMPFANEDRWRLHTVHANSAPQRMVSLCDEEGFVMKTLLLER